MISFIISHDSSKTIETGAIIPANKNEKIIVTDTNIQDKCIKTLNFLKFNKKAIINPNTDSKAPNTINPNKADNP